MAFLQTANPVVGRPCAAERLVDHRLGQGEWAFDTRVLRRKDFDIGLLVRLVDVIPCGLPIGKKLSIRWDAPEGMVKGATSPHGSSTPDT